MDHDQDAARLLQQMSAPMREALQQRLAQEQARGRMAADVTPQQFVASALEQAARLKPDNLTLLTALLEAPREHVRHRSGLFEETRAAGRLDIARVLIERGAEVNERMLALARERHPDEKDLHTLLEGTLARQAVQAADKPDAPRPR